MKMRLSKLVVRWLKACAQVRLVSANNTLSGGQNGNASQ
jgi:hypothetical protein